MFGRKVVFMGISAMATVKVAANSLKNNKGASLMYVLITLVFVGAIAMLVLNSSRKETIDSSLRASTEMARFAATSGLNQATTWLANPVNDPANAPENARTVTNILRSWHTFWLTGAPAVPADRQWLFGGETSFVPDANGARFRVQIVNADFSGMQQVTRRVERIGTTTPAQYRFQFPPGGTLPNRALTATQNAAVLSHGTGTDQIFFLPVAHPENSRATLLLKSESIDQSGSRATNMGTFTVFGFETGEVETITTALPDHAVYLRGGNMWIHCPITINGPTFIENQTNMSNAFYQTGGGGAPSFYNGQFRLVQGNNAPLSHFHMGNFSEAAYFQGGITQFTGTIPATHVNNFNGGFGGNSNFILYTANVNVAANRTVAFSSDDDEQGGTATFGGSGVINLGADVEVHYANNVTLPTNITGTSRPILTNAQALGLLGMDINEPPAPRITISQAIINRRFLYNGGNGHGVTGARLNQLWTERTGNRFPFQGVGGSPTPVPLDDQWLVIEVSGDAPFGGGGTPFNRKAIIINRSMGGGSLPEVGPDGIILFFIPEDGPTRSNFNMAAGNFRGVIFNASRNTQINISSLVAGWNIRGAFYNIGVGNTQMASEASLQLGTGQAGRITIDYDRQVICELAKLGIWGDGIECDDDGGGGGGAGGSNIFQPIPRNLYPSARAEMVNRSF
jgi:Tfp pilus assembly protein PilV